MCITVDYARARFVVTQQIDIPTLNDNASLSGLDQLTGTLGMLLSDLVFSDISVGSP